MKQRGLNPFAMGDTILCGWIYEHDIHITANVVPRKQCFRITRNFWWNISLLLIIIVCLHENTTVSTKNKYIQENPKKMFSHSEKYDCMNVVIAITRREGLKASKFVYPGEYSYGQVRVCKQWFIKARQTESPRHVNKTHKAMTWTLLLWCNNKKNTIQRRMTHSCVVRCHYAPRKCVIISKGIL